MPVLTHIRGHLAADNKVALPPRGFPKFGHLFEIRFYLSFDLEAGVQAPYYVTTQSTSRAWRRRTNCVSFFDGATNEQSGSLGVFWHDIN
jgi:hypothetical protein